MSNEVKYISMFRELPILYVNTNLFSKVFYFITFSILLLVKVVIRSLSLVPTIFLSAL